MSKVPKEPDYLRHLRYEIDMVAELLRAEPELGQLGWRDNDPLCNAYLEAILSHVRGLIEFVVGREKDRGPKAKDPEGDIRP